MNKPLRINIVIHDDNRLDPQVIRFVDIYMIKDNIDPDCPYNIIKNRYGPIGKSISEYIRSISLDPIRISEGFKEFRPACQSIIDNCNECIFRANSGNLCFTFFNEYVENRRNI